VAITGEVSLHGKVTGVGGVMQKALAAIAAGRKVLIAPSENGAELAALPDAAIAKLRIVAVDRIEDVLREALVEAPPGGPA
jgi:ATP-dependent Lon protease